MILRVALVIALVLLTLKAMAAWRKLTANRKEAPRVQAAKKCATCANYVLGNAPAPCDRADCPYA